MVAPGVVGARDHLDVLVVEYAQPATLHPAELPGVEPDKIEISVVDDTVTLSGSRNAGEVPQDAVHRYRERGYGRFSRSFRLPFRIDAANVDARCSNGILDVTLRKAEEDKPKKINVLAA